MIIALLLACCLTAPAEVTIDSDSVTLGSIIRFPLVIPGRLFSGRSASAGSGTQLSPAGVDREGPDLRTSSRRSAVAGIRNRPQEIPGLDPAMVSQLVRKPLQNSFRMRTSPCVLRQSGCGSGNRFAGCYGFSSGSSRSFGAGVCKARHPVRNIFAKNICKDGRGSPKAAAHARNNIAAIRKYTQTISIGRSCHCGGMVNPWFPWRASPECLRSVAFLPVK